MIIAYGLISRELYRGIQFELEQKSECIGKKALQSTKNASFKQAVLLFI